MSSREELFVSQLSAVDKKAIEIARSCLGSSFSISKCIYFMEWNAQFPETPEVKPVSEPTEK